MRADVQHLLAGSSPPAHLAPKALIVPHAGYLYSGAVAAAAFAALRSVAASIQRVVLIGPSHYVAVSGVAAPAVERFKTPLGHVAIDLQAIEKIADLPCVVRSDAPHAPEHSLEVELPFLQTILPAFTLVPLVVGVLIEAKRHGLRAQRLALCNSGDTAGPRDQVVGYGAWVFFRPQT